MMIDSAARAVVWLPYEPKELDNLPDGLTYHYWDGEDRYPSDPAEVRFLTGYPGTNNYTSLIDLLTQTRDLDVLQVLSSGYDYLTPHLSLLPPTARLCTGRGIHARPTAELAVTLLAALARGLPDFQHQQSFGRWTPRSTVTLAGKRVLVVGQGPVGTAVAKLLEAFACHVVRLARTPRTVGATAIHGFRDLPGLLPTVDGVMVCAPLTAETTGLFNDATLSLLPDGALVVNVGRGELIDTDALTRHVADGRLQVALDVVAPEPLPAGHPLWQLRGALITPHVGAFTDAFDETSRRFLASQLHRYARGEPLDNDVVLKWERRENR